MWLCLGWGRKVVLRFEINEICKGKECKGFGRSSMQVWIRAKSGKDLDGTQLLHLFLRKYFTFLSKGIRTTHANLDYFCMLDICCRPHSSLPWYQKFRTRGLEFKFLLLPFHSSPTLMRKAEENKNKFDLHKFISYSSPILFPFDMENREFENVYLF